MTVTRPTTHVARGERGVTVTKDAKVRVGDIAPDFTLPDQRGQLVRLYELLGGKTVVLYFYPKDATPGCTLEARAFRDSYEAFTAQDAEVIGVSSDSVRSPRMDTSWSSGSTPTGSWTSTSSSAGSADACGSGPTACCSGVRVRAGEMS